MDGTIRAKRLAVTLVLLILLQGCSTMTDLLTAPGNLGNSITSDYRIVGDRIYTTPKYPE